MIHRAPCAYAHSLPSLLLLLALLTITGCTTYPANQYGEIEMDDWCDQDASMPWTGCWEEIGQIECENGERYEAEESIGEFRLKADDVYSITRHPFEHFVDYSGAYTVTEETNSILFSPIETTSFDGEGEYEITHDGELVLRDVWFSVYESADGGDSDTAAVSCGYIFAHK